MGLKRGLDCYLYRNTGNFGSPTWALIENVINATGTRGRTKADASSRRSKFKLSKGTQHEREFEWGMLNDTTDVDLGAIEDAFLNDTVIELAFADGPIATTGTTYTRYECEIFDFSDDEPLDGVATIKVGAAPCYTTNAQGTQTTV